MSLKALKKACVAEARAHPSYKGRDKEKVKEEFDEEWGMKWHCMIGTSFGCHATHESGCFVHFYVGEWAVMLFKA